MNLLLRSPPSRFSLFHFGPSCPFASGNLSRRISISSQYQRPDLPFTPEKAKCYRELEAAVDAVQKACRLCIDVKKSLFTGDGRILEKNDQTPVTVADFGVQALISLELSRSFPSIPLVAEEDSAFLRSNLASLERKEGQTSHILVDSVLNAVADQANTGNKTLTRHDVLAAIDRGGPDAFAFGPNHSTYWVLDPIDGTRGFLKGSEALYVVGLALVVDGEIALGVMGCPNWREDIHPQDGSNEGWVDKTDVSELGVIMVAHIGCGTWKKRLLERLDSTGRAWNGWLRCFVDDFSVVHEAKFCIPDSQTWESLPLSTLFSSTTDPEGVEDGRKVLVLPTCCGSLCKYLMVASGRVSVFILRAKLRTVIKAWDHAVGIICVLEAGGLVTDWRGSPLDFAADQVGRRAIYPSGGILVTNGNLQKQILEIISSSTSVV